ncbi:MAG: Gfo/Idh/MocA family oxidoreductase, partial [Desulfosarcinaceae bacterium]
MSDKVKWGVLGNATIARVCVIPAIQKSRNGVVHALATRAPDRVAGVCAENHIDRVYADYNALIQDPDIEAVYLPLPNHLHCPWTLKALAAGKHVLCEKPLACNAGEAERMARAAGAADRLLMEGFMYRFHPRSRQIWRLVGSGAIGAARLVRAAFCFRMADEELKNPNNLRLKQAMGGGALLDVGCYAVSAARWMFGAQPRTVQAQACYHPQGADLQIAGTMLFPGDRLATLEAGFISGLQQTYSVVGEQGVIDLPQD